jgi:hypothetical protein
MSELKELSWSVQEAVRPIPFEQLERRGVRRRRRRQALTGIGVAGAVAAVILSVVVPLGGTDNTQPVAPVPSVPGKTNENQSADALIQGRNATLETATVVTAERWASSWADCTGGRCRYAARVERNGQSATTPIRTSKFTTLRVGDEAVAVAGPSGQTFTATDPSWAQTVLLRLTGQEQLRTVLRYAAPTSSFTSGEILTDRLSPTGHLLVLNLANSTLRRLEVDGHIDPRSPVRDTTGRWWVVTGDSISGSRSDIAWTDDGGRTWHRTTLDPGNPASTIAVSPNGRTIVATSWMDGATLEAIGVVRMSSDRGATWTSVRNKPWARGGGPIAFDDGTALMLGIAQTSPKTAVYRLADGQAVRTNAVPDGLDDLSGDQALLFGPQLGTPSTKVVTSTDRGATWRSFEPR